MFYKNIHASINAARKILMQVQLGQYFAPLNFEIVKIAIFMENLSEAQILYVSEKSPSTYI